MLSGHKQLITQSYPQLADSLIRRLPLLPNDTNKTFTYRDISYYLLYSNPDSAIIYSSRGHDLAAKLNFVPGQIWNLNQQGLAHEIKQSYDSALTSYEKAIALARSSTNLSAEARMLNVIGTVYYQQGNFTDAIAHYDAALKLFEMLDEQEDYAQVLNNLGIVYRIRRNYERAISIYNQSLAIKQGIDDQNGMANTMRNLGLLYAYTGEAAKSMQYLQQAIGYHTQLGNQSEVAACEIGIGSALYTLGRYDEAGHIFAKAIPRLPETSKLELLTGMLLSGSIALKQGHEAEGLKTMLEAYDYIKPSGRLELLRTAEKELALAGETTADPDMAATHWKNYALLSDSLANEQQQWTLEEMMARFENREQENMIRLQALALAEESAKNKLFLVLVLLFVLLFASALGYAINRVRINNKLKQAHALTKEALDDKELLLQEMHHRVKNNLQMLSSLLNLQIKEISDEKALSVVTSNRSRLHSIALIHQLLYARKDFRQIDMQRFVKNLTQYCQQIHDLKNRKIKLTSHIEPLFLDIDVATPVGLVINELLINAIKHAFTDGREGTINIELKTVSGIINLKVSDNGLGFQPEAGKKDSFGLKLIKTLSKKMNATLNYTIRNGTMVSFEFPVEDAISN